MKHSGCIRLYQGSIRWIRVDKALIRAGSPAGMGEENEVSCSGKLLSSEIRCQRPTHACRET